MREFSRAGDGNFCVSGRSGGNGVLWLELQQESMEKGEVMVVMLDLENSGDGFSVLLLLLLCYWKEEGQLGGFSAPGACRQEGRATGWCCLVETRTEEN